MRTVSYELSMKLKEAGVEQKGEYVYWPITDTKPLKYTAMARERIFHPQELCSAYTTDELLEMLPDEIQEPFSGSFDRMLYLYVLLLCKSEDHYTVGYYNWRSSTWKPIMSNPNLPDALAELLLWVREREVKK